MSSERSLIYLTEDGGETWHETADSGVTRLLSGGGFIDETTGFLSYGTIQPQEPALYLTQDGGQSWSKAEFLIPEEYQEIFVIVLHISSP